MEKLVTKSSADLRMDPYEEILWQIEFNKLKLIKNENTIQLIADCRKGNPKAQYQFFKSFNGYMFSIAMRYMKNKNNAEEALQESWLKVFKSLGNYTEEGKIKPWLKTIVIRTCWQAIRDLSNDVDLEMISHPQSMPLEKNLLTKMTCEEILKLLDDVPIGSREVFKMYVIDQFSHEEIADILNIKASTSRAHLARARKILKEKFNSINNSSHERIQTI